MAFKYSFTLFIPNTEIPSQYVSHSPSLNAIRPQEILHKYALTAVQNLMDLQYGWSTLTDEFIFKIVQILASPHSLINVCRPATAILKKLVEADPMNAPGPIVASSSRGPPQLPPDSVYRFGFQCVFQQMQRGKGSLETVINRLGSADTAMALNRHVPSSGVALDSLAHLPSSLMLINSLLSHVNDARWDEFIYEDRKSVV